MKKKLPIGVDNFAEIANHDNNFLFIDKSLLIKDLMDHGAKISLIIRPRRWGKTLNMSMLQHFFSPIINGLSTKGLFDDLKIAKENNGEYIKRYQGKYPVIFITFKEVKENSYEEFVKRIYSIIQKECNNFPELNTSTTLTDIDKNNLAKLKGLDKNNQADEIDLRDSLSTLSSLLFKHYNKKVIILIDEYDTPINHAYGKAYFEQVVNFFKGMFGAALKGNHALEKGVMTGILRLSKNKMLSDINNLTLYSLMEEQYSDYFGFSAQEVKLLIDESHVTLDLKDLQHWYNGYRSGDLTTIYNPWSILNCIKNKGLLKPYWIKTGDESLLRDLFSNAPKSIENKLIQLLEGGSIESSIDEYLSFDQINENGEVALWSLLWATGYLKLTEPPTISEMGNYDGMLAIPNHEVACSFRAVFPKWIRAFNRPKYDSFLHNITLGNVDIFIKDLTDYMSTIPSYFDFPKESNYHTFLLGLTASLKETHYIHSNQESGFSRPDILLIPKNTSNNLGIILELKKEAKEKSIDIYNNIATDGLQQIDLNQYISILKPISHVTQILKLCIVFHGKQFVYKHSFEQL